MSSWPPRTCSQRTPRIAGPARRSSGREAAGPFRCTAAPRCPGSTKTCRHADTEAHREQYAQPRRAPDADAAPIAYEEITHIKLQARTLSLSLSLFRARARSSVSAYVTFYCFNRSSSIVVCVCERTLCVVFLIRVSLFVLVKRCVVQKRKRL